MAIDKKTFLKTVTILHDTREQKNAHIIEALDKLGIMTGLIPPQNGGNT